MPYRLRRAYAVKAVTDLINTVVFFIAYSSVALSLFFFSAERALLVRILILAVSCTAMVVTARAFDRHGAKKLRLPLRLLFVAGLVFILWGVGLAVATHVRGHMDQTLLLHGYRFILFGIPVVLSAHFAKR